MLSLSAFATRMSLNCTVEWYRNCVLLFIANMKAKRPTQNEINVLSLYMTKMKTKYNNDSEHYLVELFVKSGLSASTSGLEYTSTGKVWKELGFQNSDPTSDIRGGGLLCLDNMLYFLQEHRSIAHDMIRRRANGWDTYETFPWAPASINLTRLVAVEFGMITNSGRPGDSVEATQFPAKSSYHMLLEVEGFSRIYVLAFLLLDKMWDEQKATYMQFNAVLEEVRRELSEAITLAPTLPQLEQVVFRRVNYFPIPAEESSLQTPTTIFNDEIAGMTSIAEECDFFKQAIPQVYYPCVEELEDFLCVEPQSKKSAVMQQNNIPPDISLLYDCPSNSYPASSTLRLRFR